MINLPKTGAGKLSKQLNFTYDYCNAVTLKEAILTEGKEIASISLVKTVMGYFVAYHKKGKIKASFFDKDFALSRRNAYSFYEYIKYWGFNQGVFLSKNHRLIKNDPIVIYENNLIKN